MANPNGNPPSLSVAKRGNTHVLKHGDYSWRCSPSVGRRSATLMTLPDTTPFDVPAAGVAYG